MNTREELIEHLKHETDVLRSENIERAFRAIDRADFVLGDYEVEAYEDYALPTFEGQTISQPTIVAFMLELLDPQAGEKILDVGSGSGYTTALLAEAARKEGEVLGLEIIPELIEFGRKNLKKYDFSWARIENAKEADIPEDHFDKILISATLSYVPEKIIRSLKDGGLLVTPTDSSLMLYQKEGDELREHKKFPNAVVFVPYIHNDEEA